MIALPTEKNQPKGRICDYKWLLYGQPGVGKTTLASQFDAPLIVDLEKGSNHLEAYSLYCDSWQETKELYKLLKNGQHGFKTVVFDTVDKLYALAVADVCGKHGVLDPSQMDKGLGYTLIKNSVNNFLTALQSLDLGIVFISHTRTTQIKVGVTKIEKTTVSLTDSPSKLFLPAVDIIGFCHYDEAGNRLIAFQGGDAWDAKARTSEVVTLPPVCALDYAVIASHFKGERV